MSLGELLYGLFVAAIAMVGWCWWWARQARKRQARKLFTGLQAKVWSDIERTLERKNERERDEQG